MSVQTLKLSRPDGNPIFKKLGVVSGFRPKPPERCSWLMIGPTGSGKSTIVASMPARTFVFDFDRSYSDFPCSKVQRITPGIVENVDDAAGTDRIDAWDHYCGCMGALKEDACKTFDTVVFDTLDGWMFLMNQGIGVELTKRYGKPVEKATEWGEKGAGWAKMTDAIRADWRALMALGYGVIVVAHSQWDVEKLPNGLELPVEIVGVRSLNRIVRREFEYVCRCVRGEGTEDYKLKQPDGKVVSLTRTVMANKLIFAPTAFNEDTLSVDTVKHRIELPKEVLIPEKKRHKGWEIWKKTYEDACAVQIKKHFTQGQEN